MLRVRVSHLRVSDNTDISVPGNGMLLLVGPNNAGKSQVLKDLMGYARDNANYKGKALAAALYEKTTEGDAADWAHENIPIIVREGVPRYTVEGWGEVGLQDFVNIWNSPFLNALTSVFLLHADGTSRLTAGNSQASIDFTTQPPAHPVQRAYRSSEIERELDRECKAAFGLGVTVDRYSGSMISLRLGPRPAFEHEEGRPSDAYLQALQALPRLEDQGDGVRSYLGLVLHIVAGLHQVLLIDEPEAFLHPPQARELGSMLAKRALTQQAFVATHSSDFVRGVLEGGSPVTIVRMTRDGNVNHAAVLQDDAVKELWADPLLRYSNLLDGLFHDAVVLCESDADCRYYSAVLDGLEVQDAASRQPQVLFTHCGGKARMSSVVRALSAVSVPVVVVADFDVLKESQDVKRLVESLGGSFSAVESDLRLVASALSADAKPLRKLTLKDEIVRRLDALPGETLDQRDADSIKVLLRAETGWDKAKRAGMSAVPQGPAHEACQRLLEKLKELRLLVVPVGELERFAPGVAGHGPTWVTEVLEQQLHETPRREAADFVREIREAARVTT